MKSPATRRRGRGNVPRFAGRREDAEDFKTPIAYLEEHDWIGQSRDERRV